MRHALMLAILVIAACTPPPPQALADLAPGAPTPLEQGWSDQDRTRFQTTAQGSHLMPLPWFLALRRTDRDEAFAADQLTRYGYLPSAGTLPVGFVPDGTAREPQLGMTCAACHTAELRYRGQAWRIDGGRANADFQAFLTDLGAAAQATLDQPARFDAFAGRVLGPRPTAVGIQLLRQKLAGWTTRHTTFMAASLPQPPWGPGRLDAFGMIFNRVTALDLDQPGNYALADAPVRYPFIWDAPRQDKTQWTGAAPNGTYLRGLARNTGEVFGVFGRFDPVSMPLHRTLHRNSVKLSGLQAIEEELVRLRAPRWPGQLGLDPVRVAQGSALFTTNCAGCHGPKASETVLGAWATPVIDVGTDPRTFVNAGRTGTPGLLTGTQQPPVVGERLQDLSAKTDILANAVIGTLLRGALLQDPGIRRAIRQDVAENRLPVLGRSQAPAVAVTDDTHELFRIDRGSGAAYEARVLTGIWAVGPYLHNGSVPTLWALLQPARDRPSRFAVGHRAFDPLHVGLETAPGPGRASFVVDAAVGNGNGGHEYGSTLKEPERWSLIEYLKTL